MGIENYLTINNNSSNLVDMQLYLKKTRCYSVFISGRVDRGGCYGKKCIISRKCMTFDDVRTKGIDGPLVLPSPTN